ncbi:hypothetical protein LCGC14_0855100 [marine sediment metagenome]|uniref:Uncharacterized protein n=1 Tax=marine sediment metagenome TaxID=412755 RepID=A0A0F9PE19_9ZZZZ
MGNRKINNLTDVDTKLDQLETDMYLIKSPLSVEKLTDRIKSLKKEIKSYLESDIERAKQEAVIHTIGSLIDELNRFVKGSVNIELSKLFSEGQQLSEFADTNFSYLLKTFENLYYKRIDQFSTDDLLNSMDMLKLIVGDKTYRIILNEKNPDLLSGIIENNKELGPQKHYMIYDQLKNNPRDIRELIPISKKDTNYRADYLIFDEECLSLELTETELVEESTEVNNLLRFYKNKHIVPNDIVEKIEDELLIFSSYDIFKDKTTNTGLSESPRQKLIYTRHDSQFYLIVYTDQKPVWYLLELD